MFDPFMTLGLSPETATFDDARARYRSLVKSHHPDVAGGDPTLMSRITRAWRAISTPDALQEAAQAICARRQPPARDPHPEAHRHDVRTSDGIIHLGPFTRGTCLRAAEKHISECKKAHKTSALKGALKGRLTGLLKSFDAPDILVPQAFSLTSTDRIYFLLETPVSPGPVLLAVPAMRRDANGGIGYSGAVAQVVEIEISENFTGLMGLGQSLVKGETPCDAVLVIEEG